MIASHFRVAWGACYSSTIPGCPSSRQWVEGLLGDVGAKYGRPVFCMKQLMLLLLVASWRSMEIHDCQLDMHQLRLFFILISSSAPLWWWCFRSSLLRGCWAFDVPAHQDITREMESFYLKKKKTFGSAAFRHQVHFSELHIQFGIWTTSSDWNIHGPNGWTTVYQQTSGPSRFGEEIRKIQGVEGFRQKWRTWINLDWRIVKSYKSSSSR